MIAKFSPSAHRFNFIDHKRKRMCWTTRLVVVYRSKLPLTYPARCSGCSESRSIFFSQRPVLCTWVCSPICFFSRTLMPPWVFLRCILRNRESADPHHRECFFVTVSVPPYPGECFSVPSLALFLCLRVQFFLLLLCLKEGIHRQILTHSFSFVGLPAFPMFVYPPIFLSFSPMLHHEKGRAVQLCPQFTRYYNTTFVCPLSDTL